MSSYQERIEYTEKTREKFIKAFKTNDFYHLEDIQGVGSDWLIDQLKDVKHPHRIFTNMLEHEFRNDFIMAIEDNDVEAMERYMKCLTSYQVNDLFKAFKDKYNVQQILAKSGFIKQETLFEIAGEKGDLETVQKTIGDIDQYTIDTFFTRKPKKEKKYDFYKTIHFHPSIIQWLATTQYPSSSAFLQYYASHNQLEKLKDLVQTKTFDNEKAYVYALMCAMEQNHSEIIEYLLSLNKICDYDVVIWSVEYDHRAIYDRYLPKITDKDELVSILRSIVSKNRTPYLPSILAKKPVVSAYESEQILYQAIEKMDLASIKALIDFGFKPTWSDVSLAEKREDKDIYYYLYLLVGRTMPVFKKDYDYHTKLMKVMTKGVTQQTFDYNQELKMWQRCSRLVDFKFFFDENSLMYRPDFNEATPKGKLRSIIRMPFGYNNATQEFQTLYDKGVRLTALELRELGNDKFWTGYSGRRLEFFKLLILDLDKTELLSWFTKNEASQLYDLINNIK